MNIAAYFLALPTLKEVNLWLKICKYRLPSSEEDEINH